MVVLFDKTPRFSTLPDNSSPVRLEAAAQKDENHMSIEVLDEFLFSLETLISWGPTYRGLKQSFRRHVPSRAMSNGPDRHNACQWYGNIGHAST